MAEKSYNGDCGKGTARDEHQSYTNINQNALVRTMNIKSPVIIHKYKGILLILGHPT